MHLQKYKYSIHLYHIHMHTTSCVYLHATRANRFIYASIYPYIHNYIYACVYIHTYSLASILCSCICMCIYIYLFIFIFVSVYFFISIATFIHRRSFSTRTPGSAWGTHVFVHTLARACQPCTGMAPCIGTRVFVYTFARACQPPHYFWFMTLLPSLTLTFGPTPLPSSGSWPYSPSQL